MMYRKSSPTMLALVAAVGMAPSAPAHAQVPSAPTIDSPTYGIRTAAWSEDGQRLAVGDMNSDVAVWDVSTGRVLGIVEAAEIEVSSVGWHGGVLATASSTGGDLRIWKGKRGKILRRYDAHAEIWDLAWSPSGDAVAVALGDKGVELIARNGKRRWRWPGQADLVAWGPKGRELIVASGGRLAWLDAATGRFVRDNPGIHLIHALELSPDGQYLAIASWEAGSDRTEILLVSPETGYRDKGLGEVPGSVSGLAWRPDGTAVASASESGVFLWSLERPRAGGQLLARISSTGVSYRPGGGFLAVVTFEAVHILREDGALLVLTTETEQDRESVIRRAQSDRAAGHTALASWAMQRIEDPEYVARRQTLAPLAYLADGSAWEGDRHAAGDARLRSATPEVTLADFPDRQRPGLVRAFFAGRGAPTGSQ